MNKINSEEDLDRFNNSEERYKWARDIENILSENTKAIAELSKSTQELVEAWESAKGFLKVIVFISKTVKVLAPIGFLFWAVYYFGKTGIWPKG